MSNLDVLLCDEISLRLAPMVIKDIYAAMPLIKASGASVVIAEQDIGYALRVTDRAFFMIEGRVTPDGPADAVGRAAIHFGVVVCGGDRQRR